MGNTTQGVSSIGAKIFGVGPMTFSLRQPGSAATPISGYVMPTINNYSLKHGFDMVEARNSAGDVDAVAVYNEHLIATFELMPVGTTRANGLASCQLIQPGGTLVISGAEVVIVGNFTDALNTGAGTRWIYVEGGEISRTNDGFATIPVTFKRYLTLDATTNAIAS